VRCCDVDFIFYLGEVMTGYQSKKDMAQDKLEQPEQEPVAWVDPTTLYNLKIGLEGVHLVYETEMINSLPLYEKPQRPWVDLTESQIEQIYYDLVKIHRGAPMPWGQIQFGKVLQAAIKEKNT
jgi:hypothetical protein